MSRQPGRWPSLERCLLVVIAVLPALLEAACPGSVKQRTLDCRTNYDTQVKGLLADRTFYSGLDAETIRNICNSVKRTLKCAQDLKAECHDSQIDSALSDLKSIAELCVYPHVFEVYARNQNCFLEQSASSRRCYEDYHERQQTVLERIHNGDDTSLDRLCSLQASLLRCIRANVRSNCNEEATRLVSVLVKPSLKLSERCSDDPPKRPTKTQSPQYETINKSSPKGNGACAMRAHWLSGLLLATLTVWQTWRQTWRLEWS